MSGMNNFKNIVDSRQDISDIIPPGEHLTKNGIMDKLSIMGIHYEKSFSRGQLVKLYNSSIEKSENSDKLIDNEKRKVNSRSINNSSTNLSQSNSIKLHDEESKKSKISRNINPEELNRQKNLNSTTSTLNDLYSKNETIYIHDQVLNINVAPNNIEISQIENLNDNLNITRASVVELLAVGDAENSDSSYHFKHERLRKSNATGKSDLEIEHKEEKKKDIYASIVKNIAKKPSGTISLSIDTNNYLTFDGKNSKKLEQIPLDINKFEAEKKNTPKPNFIQPPVLKTPEIKIISESFPKGSKIVSNSNSLNSSNERIIDNPILKNNDSLFPSNCEFDMNNPFKKTTPMNFNSNTINYNQFMINTSFKDNNISKNSSKQHPYYKRQPAKEAKQDNQSDYSKNSSISCMDHNCTNELICNSHFEPKQSNTIKLNTSHQMLKPQKQILHTVNEMPETHEYTNKKQKYNLNSNFNNLNNTFNIFQRKEINDQENDSKSMYNKNLDPDYLEKIHNEILTNQSKRYLQFNPQNEELSNSFDIKLNLQKEESILNIPRDKIRRSATSNQTASTYQQQSSLIVLDTSKNKVNNNNISSYLAKNLNNRDVVRDKTIQNNNIIQCESDVVDVEEEKPTKLHSILGSIGSAGTIILLLFGGKYIYDNQNSVTDYFTENQPIYVNQGVIETSSFFTFLSQSWHIILCGILALIILKLAQLCYNNTKFLYSNK